MTCSLNSKLIEVVSYSINSEKFRCSDFCFWQIAALSVALFRALKFTARYVLQYLLSSFIARMSFM